jgi:hypothetical protein
MTAKYSVKLEIFETSKDHGYYMVFWGRVVDGYTDAKLFPFTDNKRKVGHGRPEWFEVARARANGFLSAKLSEQTEGPRT